MATQIDTATSHVNLFDRLIDWLQDGDTDGGPNWTLLRSDSGGTTALASALFVAPGLSDAEEIHVGISLHADVSSDTYALGFWMFRSYNGALADLVQPGSSVVTYLPIWNTTMPYWFIANGQRLMIVAKVSTVYSSGYVGKFLPYGTPGEYAQPYYLGMVVATATTRWSSVVENDRNFWDPGASAYLLNQNGEWRTVQNFREQSGEVEGSASNASATNSVWPFSSGNLSSLPKTRYRECRENLDGSYALWPLVLHGQDPNLDVYGELDGAFAVSGFNNASENQVAVGIDDYLVMQNLHRTARYYYAALKLE